MMDACNAVLPTVTDNSSSLHLQSAVKAMSLAVAELRSAADKVGTSPVAHQTALFFVVCVYRFTKPTSA